MMIMEHQTYRPVQVLASYRSGHSDASKAPQRFSYELASPYIDMSVRLPPIRTTFFEKRDKWRRRAVCKGCSKRRKVERDNLLCSECAIARVSGPRIKRPTPIETEAEKSVSPPKTSVTTILCKMESPALRQQQMLSTFIRNHWKSGALNESLQNYIQALASSDISSPILRTAVDTLLFAYFGSINQDEHMTKTSQDLYGRTITMLIPAMAPDRLSTPPYSHRDVVASILLIRLYDTGRPNEKASHETHFMHLFGAVRYMQACGPACFDSSKLLDRKLFEELHLQSLLACLAYRKECPWSQPAWASVEGHYAPVRSKESWKAQWFPLLVSLPGLLEKADNLQRASPSKTRQKDLASVCAQLSKVRDDLLQFVARDLLEDPGVVDIRDVAAFNIDIEEQCFMSSSTTFSSFHNFTDPQYPFRCGFSWFFCMIADCTILRILHSDPELSKLTRLQTSGVEHSAFTSATGICRSTYYYSAINTLPIVHWMLVVLNSVKSLFKEMKAVKELGWCQAMLIATNLRRDRIRASSSPSLCRVTDLMHPMAEATRYRPGNYL